MNAKISGKDVFVQGISCCPELIYFRAAYHFPFSQKKSLKCTLRNKLRPPWLVSSPTTRSPAKESLKYTLRN